MLCNQLSTLWNRLSPRFSPASLYAGSCIEEPQMRPEATYSWDEAFYIHTGKDATILSLLAVRGGSPTSVYHGELAITGFRLGCEDELSDFNDLIGAR
jgi:hypothetical protein